MIASQLIYTSWPNGTSTLKGFMVYSKSKDITDVEEEEICAVMKYKTPNNLPYTPTDEEIEELFPKMFAYFKLSSGRVCIARSTYIGLDYSPKWGNYMIHAYVLDDIGDLVPSRMIDADIFRSRLTDDELNAPSAPESLPQIEIGNSENILSEAEVKEFFCTEARRKMLKTLAQTLSNEVGSNKKIQFCDEYKNYKYWINALGMIIPKEKMKDVYFSTYSLDPSAPILLNCLWDRSNIGGYIPENIVIIHADEDKEGVSIGCYYDAVCNRLIDGYYDGILCANSVNKTMLAYDCDDYDLAYKLAYVQKGELNYISSNDELLSILSMLTTHDADDMADVFHKIFVEYSSSELYIGDTSSIAVFKLLYPHLSSESKADLLMMYVDKKFESQKDASALYAEIKADCPCHWDEAALCFLRQSFREHLEQHVSNAASLLMCNSWITVYPRCKAEQQQRAYEQICTSYARQVVSRDMKAVSCILDSCMTSDESLYNSVYKSVCKTVLEKIGEDEKYLFEYLKLSIDKGSLFWDVLISAISIFPALERRYIQQFVALREEYASQISKLTQQATVSPAIHSFIENVDVYTFEITQSATVDDLIDLYTKYIRNSKSGKDAKNKCRILFIQKVRLLLTQSNEKESIKSAIALYDNLYRDREICDEDKNMLNLLSETIYNDDRKNIALINKCLSKTPFETIVSFMKSCQSAGATIYPRAFLIYEGHYFEKALQKDNAAAKKVVRKMYDEKRYMFLNKSCSAKLVEEFLSIYMEVMLKGMYTIYKEDPNLTAVDLLDYFLVPISKSYSHFNDDMLKIWKGDITSTNDNMDIYFGYACDKNNAFSNDLKLMLEKYLVHIGKGKRTALFGELAKWYTKIADVPHSKKLEAYVKAFEKNHLSLWEKVKNVFSVKEEEKQNGKKK